MADFIGGEPAENAELDVWGFDENGVHWLTGDYWDPAGFDCDLRHYVTGDYFDEFGLDRFGFDMDTGIHMITGEHKSGVFTGISRGGSLTPPF